MRKRRWTYYLGMTALVFTELVLKRWRFALGVALLVAGGLLLWRALGII